MQNPINRLKKNTRLFLLFIFAASLLMTGAWLAPRASALISQGKGKKAEGKEKDTNRTPEWLVRARRLRRQMRGLDSPEGKSAGRRSNAANALAEQRIDDSEIPANPFDFSPSQLFNYVFGQTYDKPREAAEYFVQKRLPEGARELPIEKYFEAQERMRAMPHFSTALDRFVTSDENVSAPLGAEGARSAATWSSLGPGNIGGRTRAILINPQDASVMYAAGVSGGVWKTINGGQTWTPIADAVGNITVSSMVMEPGNPNVIYVGTGEGVYGVEQDTSSGDFRGAGIFRTTDAGANWTRLESTKNQDFFYVNDLVISPNDKNRIYAGTKTGVWRTADGGTTWTRVLEPKNQDGDLVNAGCLDLAIRTDKQTDFIFASCGNFEQATVYRNTDAAGAGTWEAVLTDPDMGRTSLAIAPSNQEIVYALAASIEFGPYVDGLFAVFRSTSGGAANSWTAQVRNTDQKKLNTLLLTNPIIATLTDCQFDLGDDFFSQGWYDNVIAVDPLDPERVWAGGIDLFRSDDGGKNWGVASYWWLEPPGTVSSSPYSHADQHTIVFHPQYNGASNQKMFVGGDGGVFRTDNARAAVATGATATCRGENSAVRWIAINNSYGVTQFYHGSVSPDGKTYFGGTQDNGTLLGTDNAGPDSANKWKEINGGDGAYTALDFNNPNTLYASSPGISFVKSTDGGATFGDAIAGITDGGLFITPFVMDPSDPQRLWTGGDFIWRTDNGAARWFRASAITAGARQVSALAIAPTDSNRMLVGMADGYIHRNSNALTAAATTSWPSTRPRSGWVSSLVFDPGNKDIAYATYSTFGGTHVWRTNDGGATWNALGGSGAGALPDAPVHSIAVDPSNTARLYIGTDVGVFVSTDGGANWAVETTGFPNVITEALQIQIANGVTQVYAFTHGRGVWRAVINSSGCGYGLSPATVNATANASNGTINVTAQPPGCSWSATSNASWLKVNGGGSASGAATYTIEENTAFAARVGSATIAGRTFTVFQPGRVDIESPEIAITDPPGAPAVTNTSGLISIGGATKDNNAVVGVSWTTDRGVAGSATLTGGTQWRANNISLSAGVNLITVTARDAAGNLGRATLSVASTPQAVLMTVVGTGQRGSAGDGGPAISAFISRPIRIDFDSVGNLYLTDSDNHTIRKVTPQGVISTIAGKAGQSGFSGDNGPAASALLNFPIGVAADKDGNIYICDNDNNRIRKVTAATGVITTIAGSGAVGSSGDGGPATAAQFNEPQNVAVDKDGNVYISDFGNNRIRKVNASDGMISTVAGTGAAGFGGDGGLATTAQINSPLNISIDKGGNLIICDSGNNRIRKVTAADGKISTIVGKGVGGFGGDGGPATDASLFAPAEAIVDQAGNLYFSDRGNHRVRKVSADAGIITTIAGTGVGGFNGDGLAALASSLGSPTGLAIDQAGNLHIGDRDNGRVRKLLAAAMSDSTPPTVTITTSIGSGSVNTGSLDLNGTAADNVGVFQVRWSNDRGGGGVASGIASWSVQDITLLGGLNKITVTAWDANGNSGQASLAVTFNASQIIARFAGVNAPGDSGDGGPAVAARMSPFGLAVDASGALLVSDDEAHRVRRVTPGGTINAFAGSGALGASGDGAAAVNAAMNFPQDMVVDAAGSVYISDTNNHRIRRVATNGVITTYAGTGVPGFGGDGGPATQAELISPAGLALDSAGNLYIADTGNARVRKVTAGAGVITTVAGNGLIGFSGDNGPATQATFKQPTGVAVDKNGALYILDTIDSRIRRVGTDGVITTIAGTGQPGYNGDDRPALGAQINGGGLMTTDADGNLYFADFLNHRVRKISISGGSLGMITTIAGNGTAGSFGDGGEPSGAQIFLPTDVAIDGGGNIYIADWGNYLVRKIQSTAGFRTVASLSAASFLGDALAAESIVAGFGQNLGTATQLANSLPLQTSLGGTTVRVRDASGVERLAPLFYVSPTQVNFEVPPSTSNGAATITITSGDGSISTGIAQIASVAPGLFSANSNGQGVAAAFALRVKANGEQTYEPVARFDQATSGFVATPIDLGPDTDQVFLVLFGTGTRFRSSLAASSAMIGGANAEVVFVGPVSGLVGLDQSNIRLSRSLIGRGEVEVKLTVDGKTSNTVRINIK